MWFHSLFDSCVFRSSRVLVARKGCSRARRRWPARLAVEFLEDRRLLSAVHPLFDLGSTATGAFPSDRFTVADTTQNTGRRVNLPLPDLITHPSDYDDTQVLNTLDGFNMQPRLSIPFDGPIDVNTVNSQDVFLLSMGDTLDSHDHGGRVVGINQVVWDPATNTLYVESNDLLDQHARYALIMTNGVHDAGGHPVEATLAFRLAPLTLALSHDPVLRSYGLEMVEGLVAAHRAGVREQDIVTASVFRTESATAVLEKIRDQIHAGTPDPADFNLGRGGERTVFNRGDVTGIHWEQQTGDNPPSFTPTDLNLSLLDVIPGAVGQIALGKYHSPDYEVHPGEYIPPVGTRTGEPVAPSGNDIYFNLYLPSGEKPAGGWPVAIFGHGLTTSKNNSLQIAATLAAHGIATIAINMVGAGFGPLGTLTVNQASGDPVTLSAGGRGFDQNGDHVIGNTEGFYAARPQAIISARDGQRQTAADLMQLVRVIEVGMDVDGDGVPDLDPSHIYYDGVSQSGNIGTVFLAVEPDVQVGVLDVPGGSLTDEFRLSVNLLRPVVGAALAAREPPLVNSPGITVIDGVQVAAPYFNENLPLRNGIPFTVHLADGTDQVIQSPVINSVPGAVAIQQALEDQGWAMMAGDQLTYAPHLRKAPLLGVPAKSVIVQFAKGDQTVPNPTTTALLRAGDLADRATFYRNDLAHAEDQMVPKNPHLFMVSIGSSIALVRAIARGAQEQIATFFASNGTVVIQPPGVPEEFFEVPIAGPLPEGLNFIPDNDPAGPPAQVSLSQASGPIPTEAAGGSRPISGLFAALELRRTPAGPVVSTSVVDGTTMDVLTFTGDVIVAGSLADGNYTLTVHGTLLHDALGAAIDAAGVGTAGSDRVDEVFRLFGDTGGSGCLGLEDVTCFLSAFRHRPRAPTWRRSAPIPSTPSVPPATPGSNLDDIARAVAWWSIAPIKQFATPTMFPENLLETPSGALALDDIGVPLVATTKVTAKDNGKTLTDGFARDLFFRKADLALSDWHAVTEPLVEL
jgi:hypothetical protein